MVNDQQRLMPDLVKQVLGITSESQERVLIKTLRDILGMVTDLFLLPDPLTPSHY